MVLALKSMIREDSGVTMVEYGLLLALLAMVAMIGAQFLGIKLSELYDAAEDAIRRLAH